MKFKTTILLFVLNIIVFFFLFQQESPFDIKDDNSTNDELGFLPYSVSDALKIEVFGEEMEHPYVLIQDQKRWHLKEPIEWAANEFAIRRMISQLESSSATVRFSVDEIQSRNQTLADFGLESPKISIRVSYEEESFDIQFGAPVEIGDRLYMLSADKEEILVVESKILSPFLLSIDELRSEKLFSIPEFEIQSLLVEFNDDSSRRRFTKSDSEWAIDTPFIAKANEERVLAALDKLVNANIQIIGDSLGDRGQVTNFNSFARFELLGNRRNSTLLVSQYMINGDVNPDFYRGRLEGSQTIFLLPSKEIDWWRNAQNQLRERQLISFDVEDVTKLEVIGSESNDSNVRILKLENKQWELYDGDQRTDPVEFQADTRVIVDTLSLLRNLIAFDFISDSPSVSELAEYGLVQPEKTIVLEIKDKMIRLQVGYDRGDGIHSYVKFDDAPNVYLVSSEVLNAISGKSIHFRNRFIPLYDRSLEIDYFEIKDLESNEIISAESNDSLVNSSRQPISQEDAEAIIASMRVFLRDFEVSSFPAYSFNEKEINVLDEQLEWRYMFRLHLQNQEAPVDLLLTERFSGSEQIAYIQNMNLIVNLKQEIIDTLHPLLFDEAIPEEHKFPDVSQDTDNQENGEKSIPVENE